MDNRMPLENQTTPLFTQVSARQIYGTIHHHLTFTRQLRDSNIHIPGQLAMIDNGLFCPFSQDPVFYCLNGFVFISTDKFPLFRVIQAVPPQGIIIGGGFKNIVGCLSIQITAV